MTSQLSIPAIKEKFPIQNLPVLPPGKQPDYAFILKLESTLVSCTTNIPTKYAPATGAASTVLSAARWTSYFPSAFTHPRVVVVNPGQFNNATAPTANNAYQKARNQHIQEEENYVLQENVKSVARSMLTHSVPAEYFSGLGTGHLGLTLVEPINMIQHLFTEYGDFTRAQRNSNTAAMLKQYNPANPPETLWHQIDVGTQAADPYDKISDLRKQDMALNNLEATGKFKEAIAEFYRRAPVQQTWANLKRDVNAFWVAHNSTMATAGDIGYANKASTTTLPPGAITINGTPDIYGLYCHTHGLQHGPAKHTSKDCKFPGPDHETSATVFNLKGGNAYIKRTANQPPKEDYKYQKAYNKKRGRTPDDNQENDPNHGNRNRGGRRRGQPRANLAEDEEE